MKEAREKQLRFLIVKLSSIGDILQALNVASYLKRNFPLSIIHWATEKDGKEILEGCSLIDSVLTLDVKSWFPIGKNLPVFRETRHLRSSYYDYLFDLQGNCKSAVVSYLARADKKIGFGRRCVPEWPNLLVTNQKVEISRNINKRLQYLELVAKTFKNPISEEDFKIEICTENDEIFDPLEKKLDQLDREEKFSILVCPYSRWKNKELSDEILLSFLQGIEKELNPFYFLASGSENENMRTRALSSCLDQSMVVHNLSFPTLYHLASRVGCVIGVDSSVLHLCSLAQGVPIFGLFGPTKASIYKPLGKSHEGMQGICSYLIDFEQRCPYLRTCKKGACMREINVEKLVSNFNKWHHLLKNCSSVS